MSRGRVGTLRCITAPLTFPGHGSWLCRCCNLPKTKGKRRMRQLFWHTPQFSRRLPLKTPAVRALILYSTFCGHTLLPSPRVFPARTRCYVLCLRNMKSNRTPLFGTAFFNKAEADGLGIATRKAQNKQITSQHRVGIPYPPRGTGQSALIANLPLTLLGLARTLTLTLA